MVLRVEHELHRRRASRNLGLLGLLLLFAALIFGLTIAKVESGDSMKAWDHHMDNALLPENNGGPRPVPVAPAAPEMAPAAPEIAPAAPKMARQTPVAPPAPAAPASPPASP